MNRYKHYFLLLLSLSSLPLAAQETGDPGQIQRIRDHYYGLNADLSKYTLLQLGDTLTAYTSLYRPQKIVITQPGITKEYYFSPQRELLFAYIVAGEAQHRYYFRTYTEEYEHEVPTSLLIRYLRPDGTFAQPEEEEFPEQGFRVSDAAWRAHELVEMHYRLSEAQFAAWQNATQYMLTIDGAVLEEASQEDNSYYGEEEGEGPVSSEDVLTRYAYSVSGPVVLEEHITSQDGGHTVSTAGLSRTYWRTDGPKVAERYHEITYYYGVFSPLFYDRDFGAVTRVTHRFYEQGSEEPWLTREYLLSEDSIVWVKPPK